jgi:aminomethyltransferase
VADLALTPLHAWHAAHGGRLVDFADWSMPVQYGSIVNEHLATRNAIGLFDVSHMGRLIWNDPSALAAIDKLVTRRVDDMLPGQVRYGLVCNETGCALDDILVYHFPAATGPSKLGPAGPFPLMVVNAGNRDKIVAWLRKHLPSSANFTDATTELAMIAVQGPQAMPLLAKMISPDPNGLKYYNCSRATILGHEVLVSRTGYTGEDGCELMLPNAIATEVWQAILDAGASVGAKACGLGSRDTLRLEAAMPLYGHELNEQTTPLEAALGFAVTLKNGRQFIGSNVLEQQKTSGTSKIRVGLSVAGKRAPREGYPIVDASTKQVIGTVCSGSFTPTLQASIAMGFVPPAHATLATEVLIDIRGELTPATVVKLPFYTRPA